MYPRRFSAFLLVIAGSGALEAQSEIREFLGDHAGDAMGSSVARAGDVNGDGVADAIVGAVCGLAASDNTPGYARVYSGIDGTALWTVHSQFSGDGFGIAVAGGADFDGDGVPDFLVGAPGNFWSVFVDLKDKDPGHVRVYSGANGTLLLNVKGIPVIGGFGSSLAITGDMDLDGVVDFVAGAPGWSVDSEGACHVVSGANGSRIHDAFGTSAQGWLGSIPIVVGDHFGATVAGPGDLDDDGVPDFVAGTRADGFSGKSGNKARAFSGATGNMLYELKGEKPSDELGVVIASAGDMNADGAPEVAVSALSDSLQKNVKCGSVRIVSGKSAELLLFLSGELDHRRFGSSLAGLGDVNDDGRDDLAVAVRGSASETSGVRIHGGSDGNLLASWHYAEPEGGYPLQLAAAGDVDQDGTRDLLVGAATHADSGHAHLVSIGSTLQLPPESQSFFPGDVLDGSIEMNGDADSCHFLAVAGSTLEVNITVLSGSLVPVVSLHTVNDLTVGPAIATTTLTVPSGSVTIEIDELAQYALQIEGENGTTGDYRVKTSIELPPLAASRSVSSTAKKKKQGKYFAEAPFTALAGSRLDVVLTAPQGVLPSAALVDPSGHEVKKSQYSVTVVGHQLKIKKAPIMTSGDYKLRAFGGEKGDSFEFEISPLPPGTGLTLNVD